MSSLLQAMRWFQSVRLVHIVGPLATPGKECPPLKTTDLNQNSVFKNQNFTVVVFHNKTNRLFNAALATMMAGTFLAATYQTLELESCSNSP